MANPFHGETAQMNKTAGSGKGNTKSGSKGDSIPMKARSWPKVPGPTGPKRDTMGVRHPPQHTQDVGI